MNSFNWKIGGHAGEGIMVTGLILSKALTRAGLNIFDYIEYPSLIRGGHNTYQIHASEKDVFSQIKPVDILVALNKKTVILHQKELKDSSLVIYDPDEFKVDDIKNKVGHYLAVPLIELAKKAGGKAIMANTVALGTTSYLLGLDLKILKKVVADIFSAKKQEIIKLNQKALEEGYQFTKNIPFKFKILKIQERPNNNIVLTGNEAISLGAVAGGLQFFCAYPMTPSTSILHNLADWAKKEGFVVKHAEDEISVVNMAIGASFAGARAMVGTSGGGFALMNETLSLSGVTETPLVIINAQRPGPALGMPTWSAQGDMLYSIYAGHDEFPRIILAPGDVREAFKLSKLSLELAEKFQVPVILLTDKYLSESHASCSAFKAIHRHKRYEFAEKLSSSDDFFKRYRFNEKGASPRSLPGQSGGLHICNSYEHDEFGLATEDTEMRTKMMDKRLKKIKAINQTVPKQLIFGPKSAKVSLISWGSSKGPVLQALKELKDVNFLHLSWLWPFPDKQVEEFISNAKKIICLEGNATAQLASLIRQQTGIEIKNKFLKYDGRPFYPEEIKEEIKKLKN